ncbi:hypothetical protein Tco_1025576 [Tanacetum coccineum]
MGLDNKKTIHAQSETITHPNSALHPIDVENYAEAMVHSSKLALHPIDVENYDASHSDDEDEAEKDVAASYRIE